MPNVVDIFSFFYVMPQGVSFLDRGDVGILGNSERPCFLPPISKARPFRMSGGFFFFV